MENVTFKRVLSKSIVEKVLGVNEMRNDVSFNRAQTGAPKKELYRPARARALLG